jgi:hypothetical protein
VQTNGVCHSNVCEYKKPFEQNESCSLESSITCFSHDGACYDNCPFNTYEQRNSLGLVTGYCISKKCEEQNGDLPGGCRGECVRYSNSYVYFLFFPQTPKILSYLLSVQLPTVSHFVILVFHHRPVRVHTIVLFDSPTSSEWFMQCGGRLHGRLLGGML